MPTQRPMYNPKEKNEMPKKTYGVWNKEDNYFNLYNSLEELISNEPPKVSVYEMKPKYVGKVKTKITLEK